ncbi:MAG: hypothetical protein ABS69_12165 [Nitrosomonadales bacterium SCN 54-20]|nr:MAG: hypothetical protein ABS69_12165 [Nitrosomonadales bacterium SCN 54-20]
MIFYAVKKQFDRIKPYFLLLHGMPCADDLRVISGIIYVMRNGRNGRMLPKAMTTQDVLQSLPALEQDGIFNYIFAELTGKAGIHFSFLIIEMSVVFFLV